MTANEKEKDGKKREYRSAARSRRLIRDAYAALMQEKPVDKISVSDIVRLADLNRGTFYAHYANPQAVLVEISDEIVSTMQNFLVDFNFSHFLQNPLPLLSKVEELLTAKNALLRIHRCLKPCGTAPNSALLWNCLQAVLFPYI